MHLASTSLNPDHIVQAGGILVVALMIFAETGLLIGFFLPGDTLLIAAGIWAANHHHSFPIWLVLPAVAVAAILGYEVGYRIGTAAGPKFFVRNDGLFFRKDYITRTRAFFSRHGGKSLILARFVPVVRTVIPLIAGAGKMNRRFFHVYNLIGGLLWTVGVTLAAYWIGSKVRHLDKYLVYLLVLAMILTVASVLSGILRSKKSRAAFGRAMREEWRYFFKKSL